MAGRAVDPGMYGASIIKSAMVDSHCSEMAAFLSGLQAPADEWSDIEDSPPPPQVVAKAAVQRAQQCATYGGVFGSSLSASQGAVSSAASDAANAFMYNNHLGIEDAVRHLPFGHTRVAPAATATAVTSAASAPCRQTEPKKRVTIATAPPSVAEISALSLSSDLGDVPFPRASVPTVMVPRPPPRTRRAFLESARQRAAARQQMFKASIAGRVKEVHASRRQMYLTDTASRRKIKPSAPAKPAWRGGGARPAPPSPGRKGAFSCASVKTKGRTTFKGALFGDLMLRQVATLVFRALLDEMHAWRHAYAAADEAYCIGALQGVLARFKRNVAVAKAARRAERAYQWRLRHRVLAAWRGEVRARKAEKANTHQAHLFYFVSLGRRHLHAWRYHAAWGKAAQLGAAYTAAARRQRRWRAWKAAYARHSELKARVLNDAAWGCAAVAAHHRVTVDVPDAARVSLTILRERAREAAHRAGRMEPSLQHSLMAHSVVSGLQLFDVAAAVRRGVVPAPIDGDDGSISPNDPPPPPPPRRTRRTPPDALECLADATPDGTPQALTLKQRWSVVYSPHYCGTGDNTLMRTQSQHRLCSPDSLKNVVILGGIEDYVNTTSAKAPHRQVSLSPRGTPVLESSIHSAFATSSRHASGSVNRRSTALGWPAMRLGLAASPDEQSDGPPTHAECAVRPYPKGSCDDTLPLDDDERHDAAAEPSELDAAVAAAGAAVAACVDRRAHCDEMTAASVAAPPPLHVEDLLVPAAAAAAAPAEGTSFDELHAALGIADAAVMKTFNESCAGSRLSSGTPPRVHAMDMTQSPWGSVSPPCWADATATPHPVDVHTAAGGLPPAAAALSPEVLTRLSARRDGVKGTLERRRLDDLPSGADGMLTPEAVRPLRRLPLEQALLRAAALTSTQRVFFKWRRALRQREAERSAARYHTTRLAAFTWAAWRAVAIDAAQERCERAAEAAAAAVHSKRLRRTAFTLWQFAFAQRLAHPRHAPSSPAASSIPDGECEWDCVAAAMQRISGSPPPVGVPLLAPPHDVLDPETQRSGVRSSSRPKTLLRPIQNTHGAQHRAPPKETEGGLQAPPQPSPPRSRSASTCAPFVTEVIADWANARTTARAFRRWYLRTQYEVLTRRKRAQLQQKRCFDAWRRAVAAGRQRAGRVAKKYRKYALLRKTFRAWRLRGSLRPRRTQRAGPVEGAAPGPPLHAAMVAAVSEHSTPHRTVERWVETLVTHTPAPAPPASRSERARRTHSGKRRALRDAHEAVTRGAAAPPPDPASSEAQARQRLLDLAQRVNISLKREVGVNDEIGRAMDRLNNRYCIAPAQKAR
eukprot:TRINITY_DN17938_c0_g1_i1.p1 TRINITY_DN17938_c0_g1~~TRINITY_DN17938_c0_g1_i1.p1  ORF type:complete len:1350 (+),score=429.19 TRINITY_DN17938_c0_g1_i1:68-4051(+)